MTEEKRRTASRITAISLVCPQVEFTNRSVIAQASEGSGLTVTLHRGERVFLDERRAITALGKAAGAAICNTCPLYNLSGQEVENIRIGYLEIETTRLEAEERALEIQQQVSKPQLPDTFE